MLWMGCLPDWDLVNTSHLKARLGRKVGAPAFLVRRAPDRVKLHKALLRASASCTSGHELALRLNTQGMGTPP